MRHYEIKNIFSADFEEKGMIKDVDLKSRTVQGYFSRFGNIDTDGDMLMPGAFTKSIKERGLDGANMIPHLADHTISTGNLLAKPKLYEVADGGMFESTITDTTKGLDILKQYRDGLINQHSFGFKTIKQNKKSDHNAISEVLLYEVSTVVLGANPSTPFTGFKGMKTDELIQRYELLKSCYYNGDYSDDVFPILKAQLNQITDQIVEEFLKLKATTEPVQPTLPEQDVVKDAIYLLTMKHF